MDCPKGHHKTIVVDSRKKGSAVRRRRLCLTCERRFNTVEIRVNEGERLDFILSAIEAFRASQRRVPAHVPGRGERGPVSPKRAQVGSR